jgi:DNA ligase-1
LAVNWNTGDPIQLPMFATPKIDGIRALKINGKLVSRSLKPIKNKKLAKELERLLPDGSDGEVFIKNGTFQDVTSFVMSADKNWIPKVQYFWFDYVKSDSQKGYMDRIKDMKNHIQKNNMQSKYITIIPLYPKEIKSEKDIGIYETKTLKEGFEGIMLRKKDGPYKMGRSTLKEQILLKVKRFSDDEATVIGFEELMKNNNGETVNELNVKVRNNRKEGMEPQNSLGAFIVKSKKFPGKTFKIGTGLDEIARRKIWKNKKNILGKLVKYKYFQHGSKDRPRHPVFLGFRDKDDM